MIIGSKAFSSLWKEWQKEYQPLQVLKLLLPATAGAEVIACLYRDARGSIWGDKGNSAFIILF